ncbi:DUF6626 family protein [Devosia sp. CAU 1758]
MTQGIEFLEIIYGQLHDAGIVRSKGEFSERLLDKSPSYLTSMRARQRVVSSAVVMGLGDNLMVEIRRLGVANHDAELQSKLRRAMAQVNLYLADSHMPAGFVMTDTAVPSPARKFSTTVMNWIGAVLAGVI